MLEDTHFSMISLSSPEEELLVKEIILTHDPDDRYLDTELLLHLLGVFFGSTTENILDAHLNAICACKVGLTGSEEPISLVIYKLSNQIVNLCFEDVDLHRNTLFLLETVSHFRWDAKVVIAMAAFAHQFTLFWFISQRQSENALAASLAVFKQLHGAITKLKLECKALNLLIKTMLQQTKILVGFEGMFLQHELVDADLLRITKYKICMATYWIFRSILLCFSEITDYRSSGLDEKYIELHSSCFRYSDKTVIATWRLHSAGSKLNSLCQDIGRHVFKCQQQIDMRFHYNLQNLFKEKQMDNQMVLGTLFASQNKFPFKDPSSGEKCGVLELKNKVVMLLISKPQLIPLDKVFLLVQQIHDHPHRKKLEGRYAVLWVPIPSTSEWNHDKRSAFENFSNCLPCFSIRRPWQLNSTVVNYVKQEWFMEEPIMVILDENGMVSNKNAMDTVWIWGLKAFPFSTSREREIWEQENWILDFMISSDLVEEGKHLCIFGSDDIVWIRECIVATKKMKLKGIQMEAVYVGWNNPGSSVEAIIDTIEQERLCKSLSFRRVQLFWFLLERIKRRRDEHIDDEPSKVETTLAKLVEVKGNERWALISEGGSADMLKLDVEKLKECIDLIPWWVEDVGMMGLVGAIRNALNQQQQPSGGENCSHTTQVIPYEGAGLTDKQLLCASCRRPMEKFVLYRCDQ